MKVCYYGVRKAGLCLREFVERVAKIRQAAAVCRSAKWHRTGPAISASLLITDAAQARQKPVGRSSSLRIE